MSSHRHDCFGNLDKKQDTGLSQICLRHSFVNNSRLNNWKVKNHGPFTQTAITFNSVTAGNTALALPELFYYLTKAPVNRNQTKLPSNVSIFKQETLYSWSYDTHGPATGIRVTVNSHHSTNYLVSFCVAFIALFFYIGPIWHFLIICTSLSRKSTLVSGTSPSFPGRLFQR